MFRKKLIFYFAVIFLFTGTISDSFSQAFEVKSNVGGIGFGPAMKFGHKGVNKPAYAIKILYDKGIIDLYPAVLMIGGDLSYIRHRHITPDSTTIYGEPAYTASWSQIATSLRIIYYYNCVKFKIPHLHLIAGVSLGMRYVSFIDKYYIISCPPDLKQPANDGLRLYFSAFAGASYHLTRNIAFYANLGYSESWLTVGLLYTIGMKRIRSKI